MSYYGYYEMKRLHDKRKRLEAERKYGKPIMKDYRTGEWVPAHYSGGLLFEGRPEKKNSVKVEIKRKIKILDIKNNETTPKTVVKFIEDYELSHSEEIWEKEAEKIYSTGGETLYQFRGKYYRGTRPFISSTDKYGRKCGYYGEETLQLMRDREENNITLSNIRNAIEYSKDLTI